MNTIKSELLELNFEAFYEHQYGRLLVNDNFGIGVCEALEPYIPVDQFMELFQEAGKMVKRKKVRHFIFDKRLLRSFHQPSMEWYFIEWKQDMLDLGLNDHYKILPDEDWFKKCVEAGKAQILEAYPENRLNELTITYVDSVAEAVNHIKSKATINV